MFDIFHRSAVGFVLPKRDKLEVLKVKTDDEKLLFSVKNSITNSSNSVPTVIPMTSWADLLLFSL